MWLLMIAAGFLIPGAAILLDWPQAMRRRKATKKSFFTSRTQLMTAAKNGQAGLVKDLLGLGAEVNEKDKSGQTAVMKAAENGHDVIVRILLGNGAEANEKDRKGETALTLARAKGHADIVDLLKKAGAKE
jgi:ankyrin repeat protein